MSNVVLQSIMTKVNPLRHLQEFVVSGTDNQLTLDTVLLLALSCPQLRLIGDLRDWNIQSQERKLILPKLQQGRWETSKKEPKDEPGVYSGAMMLEENTLLHGLSVEESLKILSRKLG